MQNSEPTNATQRYTQRNATLYATQRNATQRYTYNTCLLQIYIFDVRTPKTVFFFLKQNIHLTVCVLSVELYLEKPFFFCYILKVGWFIINLVERGCVTYRYGSIPHSPTTQRKGFLLCSKKRHFYLKIYCLYSFTFGKFNLSCLSVR